MKIDIMKFKKSKALSTVFIIIIVILSLSLSISCSKKNDKKTSQAKILKKRSPVPVLVKVEIDPAKPTSIDFIRAVPVLEDPGMQKVQYKFDWYVNNEAIEGVNTRNLDRKFYKKGDKVYCRVSANRGKFESKIINSDVIKIGNSAPDIVLTPVGKFTVPGNFHYQIQAKDPDGDELKYYLVEPIVDGLHLNSDTGEIQWNITEMPEPETDSPQIRPEDEGANIKHKEEQTSQQGISNRMQIVFEVRDSDDAVARGSIILDLEKGEEIPQ